MWQSVREKVVEAIVKVNEKKNKQQVRAFVIINEFKGQKERLA